MLLDRFTGVVRVSLRDAAEWAERLNHQNICPVHVVLAMMAYPRSQVATALKPLKVPLSVVLEGVRDAYPQDAPGRRHRPLADAVMVVLREVADSAGADDRPLGTALVFARLLDDPAVTGAFHRARVSVGDVRAALAVASPELDDEAVAGEVQVAATVSAASGMEKTAAAFQRRPTR